MTTIMDTKSQASQSSAIIVGVLLSGDDQNRLTEELDELTDLLQTLQIPVRGRIIQRRQKLTAKCLLGSGKVEEIKALADQEGASLIVFDRMLSAPQIRNLEDMTHKQVLDRTGIILEIFSRHARTTQAKKQVELARLQYLMPRMTGAWSHLDRQKGGGGLNARGMGETQIEVDRRRARERMARLRTQLDQIQKERATQRKSRSNELKVAIVGYTNSGKTTIMNALTKATIEGRDELFATLDTNIKVIDPKTRPKILLSDTVGFIRNLPHSLVESFKSTLDEVKEADLLLHVVDVSHPCYDDHIRTTEQVLEEIGAGDVPVMMVFNKADQLDDPVLLRVLKGAYRSGMVCSAYDMKDVLALREKLYDFFKNNLVKMTIAVPSSDQNLLSFIYNTSLILQTEYVEDDKILFRLQTSPSAAGRLKPFTVDGVVEDKEAVYESHYTG